MAKISLIILLFSFFTGHAYADAFSLNDGLESESLGHYIEYLPDEDGTLTLEKIISLEGKNLPWIKSDSATPGFGYTKTVYWVKFSVKNTEEHPVKWLLQQRYPLIGNLTLCIPDRNGSCSPIKTGYDFKYSQRSVEHRSFVFPLKIESGQTDTFYLRYQSAGNINVVLNAVNPKFFEKMVFIEYALLWLSYGGMFILCIYNILIFISIRQKSYLYYALYILSVTVLVMVLNGTAFQYLWPEHPWWGFNVMPVLVGTSTALLIQFLRHFLKTRELNARFDTCMRILALASLCSFIPAVFNNFMTAMVFSVLIAFAGILISSPYVLYLAFVKRSRESLYLVPGFTFFFVGILIYFAKTFGFIIDSALTDHSLQAGFMLQVVLFSLGLADQINTAKNKLTVLNATLEEKVEDRTRELHAANEELEAMNEQLIDTNSMLENAQRIARIDMDMAVNVQTTLLPREAPNSADWDIAFAFRPLAGVSGDFYDFYTKDGKLDGVSIFDISGHGIASGLITMIARSVFFRNFYEDTNVDLGSLMANANRELIMEMGEVENYMTGVILRIKDDTVEYVNAAHTDLLCRRADSGQVGIINRRKNDIRGSVLGIEAIDSTYETFTFKIRKGDILLLYTDCLNESRNTEDVEYGVERIAVSLRSVSADSARQVLDAVLEGLYTFLGNRPLNDDLTVFVLKKK